MAGRQLLEMPDAGKVIIANPLNRSYAAEMSDRDDLPYMLDGLAPLCSLYVLDMDAMNDWPPPVWTAP